MQRSIPDWTVTGRMKLTVRSTVVKFSPDANVVTTANPMALSSSDASAPPWATSLGL
jgi:hypothetical protein